MLGFGARMRRADTHCQRDITSRPSRRQSRPPRVIATLRKAEHAAHRRTGCVALIRTRDCEDSEARPRRPREPGHRFSRNVTLHDELLLATEALEFGPLIVRQHVRTLASIRLGLNDSVPNRLLRRLELVGHFCGTASSAGQRDDPLTLGRRIRSGTTGHRGRLLCHRDGGSTKAGQV